MDRPELLTLLQNARNKDQKAQTRLINFFWVDVFSFVLKKVQDQRLADEITVSVFSKILAKLHLYDPAFQFKTWALTIAQNTIVDHWRKNRSENRPQDIDLEVEDFARSPEELMISAEERQSLDSLIDSMDQAYKEIIKLRFYEEKSIKEIAEALQISQANAKVRIMRAKKVLAQLLRENNINYE